MTTTAPPEPWSSTATPEPNSDTASLEPRLKRAEINRRNATRSTGPKSPAGKMRVRMNALKHGLRAQTLVLPGEDEAAYQARLDRWTEALRPRDEVERCLVARAVHASWNLDRVDRARAARRDAARYADADRLAAQAEQVVALGRRLLWDPNGPLGLYPHAAPAHGETVRVSWSGDPADPDDPARLLVRLEASALGCAWLLERWGELRELLEDGLVWQPHDRLKAIRLLGRQPLEAVDDQRVMAIYLACWAMEPGSAHGFTDLIPELTAKERPVYLDRLNAREPMAHMPAGPAAARAELLALIAEEEGRLEAALAGHLEREEAEAAAEQAFDATAYGERLRRYEQSNDRLLVRILETLRKRQEAAGATPPRGRAPARSDVEDHPAMRIAPAAVDAPTDGIEFPAGPDAAPEETETPGGGASRPAGSDPVGCAAGPAETPPPEAAGEDERGADDLTEEEILAGCWRIAEALGLGPATPAADVGDEAVEEPGPTPAGTEPRPAADPGRGPAGPTGVAAIASEVLAASERGPRHPTVVSERPGAAVRRVVGAVLALFAPLVFAGLPAAAARSSLDPTATNPGRPIGGSLARGSSRVPTSAGWLCSSRAPDAAIPRGGARETSLPREGAEGTGIGSRRGRGHLTRRG